jgi:hypothetical protein
MIQIVASKIGKWRKTGRFGDLYGRERSGTWKKLQSYPEYLIG